MTEQSRDQLGAGSEPTGIVACGDHNSRHSRGPHTRLGPLRFTCPDGSWSKWFSRRCVLPFMHTGPHRYEMRILRIEESDD